MVINVKGKEVVCTKTYIIKNHMLFLWDLLSLYYSSGLNQDISGLGNRICFEL